MHKCTGRERERERRNQFAPLRNACIALSSVQLQDPYQTPSGPFPRRVALLQTQTHEAFQSLLMLLVQEGRALGDEDEGTREQQTENTLVGMYIIRENDRER